VNLDTALVNFDRCCYQLCSKVYSHHLARVTTVPSSTMSKELGTLVIVVLKAQHLIDNHTFYKQDPYAKLSLSGATKQTPVDPKGGQHPVWDVELHFPISRDPSKSNRTLAISVFLEEKKDDELLGEGTIDITNTLKSGEFDGAPTFLSHKLLRAQHGDRLGAIESEGHSAQRCLS
jgi:Ca2+-dependent lipid-binding protein